MITGLTVSAMFGCIGAGWTPEIGDPTAQGWITVLAYLACAGLAFLVWHRLPQPALRRFWAVTAGLMLLLALNKQLDLQTAFTETGRCLSYAQGWYPWRRLVQLLFIAGFAAGLVVALRRGARMMRGYLPSHRLALAGIGFVAGYVLIRATSFHLVDVIGGTGVAGLSMNFILENAGLVLIAANAAGLLAGRIVPTEPLPEDTPASEPEPGPGTDRGERAPFQPLEPRDR